MLKELARAPTSKGGDTKSKSAVNDETPISAYSQALESANISRPTAHRWQQLAEIPKAEFEAALADPVSKPTTNKLIQSIRESDAEEIKAMDRDALRMLANRPQSSSFRD